MAHETPIVKVELRDRLGTRYARRLRKNGRLPATIYSKGKDPISVSVDEKEVLTHLHAGSHIIELDNGDGNPATVLVKDLQFGYLGDNLIHVDFARVNMKQVVTINMTLELSGQPTKASEAGAILEIPRPEIEIECMVQDIPDSIKVDLTTVEEVFTIGDLILPDGVRAILDPERHIAHVTIIQEEIDEPEASTEDGDDATPEVISESPAEETSEEGSE
ncbi:MAG: 50S ribosomal protein L25 [Phycisphaerae bacterium]|jgi:large subunit ribosomal protein L25|nr:50S ribosomal protein L25 [Phycisphaerae bacterium]